MRQRREGKELEADMLLGIYYPSPRWGFHGMEFWRQADQGPGAWWYFVSFTSMLGVRHWESW